MTKRKDWKETADHIIKKFEQHHKPATKNFKKWLHSRDDLKFQFFDSMVYYRAYHIQKRLKIDYDHISVITGLEGCGKSTDAAQFCAVVSPTFSLKHICYELINFLDAIEDAKPGDSILIDEGGMFLFSREAMSETNRLMTKLLMLSRQKNLHICICIPLFKVIERYIRDHRIETLINITKRGCHILYIKRSIQIISEMINKGFPINKIRVPNGTFNMGYFVKRFPEINDLDWNNYSKNKMDHLNKFIREIRKNKVKEPEYQTAHDISKDISISRRQLIRLVDDGKIQSKMFGKRRQYNKGDILKWFKNDDTSDSHT